MFPFTARTFASSIKILGFPTRIRPGFWLFSALIVLIYPLPLGIWIAVAVALFTLIHELGHALAARRAGCTASIALDFMVAYAAYESPRELSWQRKAAIALAGPALQVAIATALLVATGTNPLIRESIARSDFSIAVWWAGAALGLLNLIPLLPLDGGAIAASLIDSVRPGRGRFLMSRVSFVATTALFVGSLLSATKPFLLLLVLLLFMQWQEIQQPRRIHKMINNPDLAPSGNPTQDLIIASALLEADRALIATQFAARAYQLCPSFRLAIVAARACLVLNDPTTAVQWLRAAQRSQFDNDSVPQVVSNHSEFGSLRTRADVSAEWFTNR